MNGSQGYSGNRGQNQDERADPHETNSQSTSHSESPDGGERSEQAGEQLKQAVRQIGQTLGRSAQTSGGELKHGVNHLLDQQKSAATNRMDAWAHSIRQAASHVNEDDPQIGGLLDQAASKVESAGSYLRDHDLRGIVQGFNRFGRQHPLILMGGMFLAGAIAARFIKSSQKPRDSRSEDSESDHAHGEPPYIDRSDRHSDVRDTSASMAFSGTHERMSGLRGGLEGSDL